MSPPPLALEIYYQIIGHITQNIDLAALTLCCRSFRDEAQRKLFRDPCDAYLTFVRQCKLFDIIIESPGRLAPMVKSYKLKSHFSDGRPDTKQARNAAAAALHLMCNLKTLAIDVRWSRCIDVSALLDCPFKLHTLVVARAGGRYTPNGDPLLLDFLRKQPSLRNLTISGENADPVITQSLRDDPTWCPNLVSLAAETSLMDMFLAEHRPIQHLHWYGPTSGKFGQSRHLSSLKYLSCSSYLMANVSFLQTFQRMTSLILLDVYIHDADGEALVEQLYLHKNIPQLQYLILSGLEDLFANRGPGPEDVRTAFELCPTLLSIDISMTPSVDSDLGTVDRYYPPDASGEMVKTVMQKYDVYAWKKALRR